MLPRKRDVRVLGVTCFDPKLQVKKVDKETGGLNIF